MARTPGDLALLLDVIAGADPADPPTSSPLPRGGAAGAGLVGRRIGMCSELMPIALAPAVAAGLAAARACLEELGAEIVEVSLPEAAGAAEIYMPIQRAEALFAHTRAGLYPARADEYGSDVRRWLELSTEVTPADYLAATAEREALRAGFRRVFRDVDLLLSPVAACPPFSPDEETVLHAGEEHSVRELVLGFTVPQDLAGAPACAVRAGFDELGCPVGVQLTGPLGGEEEVLAAAADVFVATPELQGRRPKLEPPLASGFAA